jgi:anti-sigma factor RsiW
MSTAASVSCEELIGFLADYLDGELSESRRMAFDRHLEVCESCVRYIASYHETIRLARDMATSPRLPIQDMPEELVAAIMESFKKGNFEF